MKDWDDYVDFLKWRNTSKNQLHLTQQLILLSREQPIFWHKNLKFWLHNLQILTFILTYQFSSFSVEMRNTKHNHYAVLENKPRGYLQNLV